MEIVVKNIGKVKEANIKINGITVIAGENDTGKSTISKALFTVFNSFYNINDKVKQQRKRSIENIINKHTVNEIDFDENFFNTFFKNSNSINLIANTIIENFATYIKDNNKLKNEILNYFKNFDLKLKNSTIEDISQKIGVILNISNKEIESSILTDNLNNEFNGQINNIFINEKGIIEIKLKNKQLKFIISNDKVEDIEKTSETIITSEAVYLDDPFIIDKNFDNEKISNHKIFLVNKLFYDDESTNNNVEKIAISKKLENIYNRLNIVCPGNMVESNKNTNDFSYRFNNKELDIKNLSAGLKTFVILKTLLEKGILEENGVIILDEPEIHLHPAWQVIFAELIVLIQKEFNMHILLNTHSPYFLNAIEIYAEKHNIKEKCNFYSAYLSGQFSEFKDVTDNIEEIYYKLARPFQDLENERYSDD
ncbi:AAA family ATPase [Fusobacterium nucleatum]|uniref:AAA family ATPase n=1 Tax=Fusobacterium nucleatum TaxID=851 RepID=UPI002360E7F7|nr:AAA family ATPase [Fusobacterium nucleatum]WDD89202.1 AAA family ATPase [Fusobacterium nucleatum]